MAHESRLTAFEQALKDEGIKGTNLEPVARSIFQQESSSGANVKTSNAGARGPMQVLPATFKAYNPQGNIDNPYDNSVGGLRYIKDLYSKTNDPGLTAVGY
jgi:SLT domain-containing protein